MTQASTRAPKPTMADQVAKVDAAVVVAAMEVAAEAEGLVEMQLPDMRKTQG